jgi:hypothetical protein
MSTKTHKCQCGKEFSFKQGLSKHRKTCDNTQQIQNTQIVEIEHKHKLQILEIEHKHKMQIQELEHKHKLHIQELESKFKLLETKVSSVNLSVPHKDEQVLEKPAFCLKSYMNQLKPILLDQFKSDYQPTIIDYDNISLYGIVDGLTRNIIKYINQYDKTNLPILVSNNQTARFRVYYYTKSNDDAIKWCKYDGQEGINILNDIVGWLINKYMRNINIYYAKYPTHTDGIQNENNMLKKENMLYNIGKADTYVKQISNAIQDCFIINKD